jgi:hypothetical protein
MDEFMFIERLVEVKFFFLILYVNDILLIENISLN